MKLYIKEEFKVIGEFSGNKVYQIYYNLYLDNKIIHSSDSHYIQIEEARSLCVIHNIKEKDIFQLFAQYDFI